MRRFAALAVGCALSVPLPSAARPFTVSDLLAQERFGSVQIDSQQRWLIVQKFARWDSARRYDMDADTVLGLSRVHVFDLANKGAERSLDFGDATAGYVPAGLSPNGEKLAVYKIAGHEVDVGVVTLKSGQVTWLGVTPRLPMVGRTLAWRDDRRLIVATRRPEALDSFFGYGWLAQSRLPPMWETAAKGGAAVSAFGSGRWLGLRAKGPVGALLSIDLESGRRTVLADETVVDLEVSPQGASVAALAEGEDLAPRKELARADESVRRRRLVVVDLETGAKHAPLPDGDVITRLLSWAPSGDHLLVFARTANAPWREGRYYQVAPDGRAEALAPPGLTPAMDGTRFKGALARGAWLEDSPVVRLVSGQRDDWWRITRAGPVNVTKDLPAPAQLLAADGRTLLMQADGRLWRVSAQGARMLPKSVKARILRATDAGDRSPYATPRLNAAALVDGDGTSLTTLAGERLAPLRPGETLVALAPRRGLRVAVARDDHGVEAVEIAARDGERQAVLSANASLAAIDFAPAQPVRYKGIDGETLTSWLYMPPGASAQHKAPLVVLPYPGQPLDAPPAGQTPPASTFTPNAQILAGQGYAVLIPALPYRQAKDPVDGLADQILAAVDAAAGAAPIDVDRLALYGHSYGGYAVVVAATQSPRFKAIISASATTDLISAYGRQPPAIYAAPDFGPTIGGAVSWLETGQTRMGGPPWSDPERYLRNSPLLHADRIVAPVLMIYGDLDNDVGQPEALFAALFRQNKDAVLAIYRGETHVQLSPGNIRDMHARVSSFLRDTIGPGLAP